jgi:hypothetical protein
VNEQMQESEGHRKPRWRRLLAYREPQPTPDGGDWRLVVAMFVAGLACGLWGLDAGMDGGSWWEMMWRVLMVGPLWFALWWVMSRDYGALWSD